MDLDPYAELEVERDADAAEIRKAHRRRVRKTHPDVGGTAEAFARTQTALAVLTNPQRRKTYDQTGKIEEPEPDNTEAGALTLLSTFVDKAIEAYINGGGVHNDPRRRDILAEFSAAMNQEITGISVALIESEKGIKFLVDMKRRFKTKKGVANSIAARLQIRIQEIEAQRVTMRQALDMRHLALKLAKTYDFERDEPAPPAQWPTATVGGMWSTTTGR